MSQDLTDKAILAGMSDRLNPIKKMSELSDALLDSYWRASIVRFDVPSNSQSFGNIVRAAKIEAIKYRSKYSSGYCLAIFPENLALGSFLELSDKSAPNVITRLDSTNFGQLT